MPVVALTLTDSGRNLRRDALKGTDSCKVLYWAIGSGSTAPTTSDTKLQSETLRKAVSSVSNGASVGECLISAYLSPSDAVGANIQEVGVFAGNSAKSTANSGVMLGRALWAHNPKTNLESITLQLDLVV
jgi:hypothetical protein